jgi:hypothetical protein
MRVVGRGYQSVCLPAHLSACLSPFKDLPFLNSFSSSCINTYHLISCSGWRVMWLKSWWSRIGLEVQPNSPLLWYVPPGFPHSVPESNFKYGTVAPFQMLTISILIITLFCSVFYILCSWNVVVKCHHNESIKITHTEWLKWVNW